MHRPRKRFGQNFLRDQHVLDRIVNAAELQKGDRIMEIGPGAGALTNRLLETGLPVHNVVGLRSQPGGAGTILNNLSAFGTGQIHPIGFVGHDGEGFELRRALAATAVSKRR